LAQVRAQTNAVTDLSLVSTRNMARMHEAGEVNTDGKKNEKPEQDEHLQDDVVRRTWKKVPWYRKKKAKDVTNAKQETNVRGTQAGGDVGGGAAYGGGGVAGGGDTNIWREYEIEENIKRMDENIKENIKEIEENMLVVGSDLPNLKARFQAIGSETERKQMTLQPSDVVNINMVKENIKAIEEIMLVVGSVLPKLKEIPKQLAAR